MQSDRPDPAYRPCVGLALFDRDARVFLGARSDLDGMHWQLPQGGIDPGETPEEAALREMEEEIGTRKARIIGRFPRWISYDFPPDIAKTRWKGRYRGQAQIWFALGFEGEDSDIRIDTAHPEFKAWRWAAPDQALQEIVPFKRAVYSEVLPMLAQLARAG